jgi:hypothetical protein
LQVFSRTRFTNRSTAREGIDMTPNHHSTYSNNHTTVPQQLVGSEEVIAAVAAAEKNLQKVTGRAETFAKQNPWVAAGAALGLGAMIGAFAYRFFAPRATVSDLLGIDELPARARRAVSKYF